MTTPDPTDDAAYRLFQQRFGALRRTRQTETLLTAAAPEYSYFAEPFVHSIVPGSIYEGTAPQITDWCHGSDRPRLRASA